MITSGKCLPTVFGRAKIYLGNLVIDTIRNIIATTGNVSVTRVSVWDYLELDGGVVDVSFVIFESANAPSTAEAFALLSSDSSIGSDLKTCGLEDVESCVSSPIQEVVTSDSSINHSIFYLLLGIMSLVILS